MMLYDVVPEKYEIKNLNDTNSWDSKKENNKQICINLIDNAIIDYNNNIDNIINKKLDIQIPYIDKIDELENTDKGITCRIFVFPEVVKEFKKAFMLKYDSDSGLSRELNSFMKSFSDDIFQRQHHTTSSFLKFDGKETRKDVLMKLEKIGSVLSMRFSTSLDRQEINQIIVKALGIQDQRTVKKYANCLMDFAEGMMGEYQITNGMFNLRGLGEAVSEKIRLNEKNLGSKNG